MIRAAALSSISVFPTKVRSRRAAPQLQVPAVVAPATSFIWTKRSPASAEPLAASCRAQHRRLLAFELISSPSLAVLLELDGFDQTHPSRIRPSSSHRRAPRGRPRRLEEEACCDTLSSMRPRGNSASKRGLRGQAVRGEGAAPPRRRSVLIRRSTWTPVVRAVASTPANRPSVVRTLLDASHYRTAASCAHRNSRESAQSLYPTELPERPLHSGRHPQSTIPGK